VVGERYARAEDGLDGAGKTPREKKDEFIYNSRIAGIINPVAFNEHLPPDSEIHCTVQVRRVVRRVATVSRPVA